MAFYKVLAEEIVFGKLYPMKQFSGMMRQGGRTVTSISYWLINTFTNELYKGNPAAICLLDEEVSEETMQKLHRRYLSRQQSLLKKTG